MDYDPKIFAANLRAGRARLDMSQDLLAMAAGISTYSLAAYESGEQTPGADKVSRIAKALGTTPNALLGWPSE